MAAFVREPCADSFAHRRHGPECTRRAQAATIAVAVLGSAMAFIDASAVNVALPIMQTDFGATNAAMQWVVEAYALLLSAFMLVGGALGDKFGVRRVFLIGVAGFVAASLACALSRNPASIIAARAVQGCAGALLTPGSLALIGLGFEGDARAKAVATWSALTAVASTAGPLLGGWLVDHLSWRYIFLINVPFGIAVMWLALAYVPARRPEASADRVDWMGAALVTLGLGGVVFALIQSQAAGTSRALIAVAGVVGVASLVWFVVNERHAHSPMMPLALFGARSFVGANVLTLFLYAALGGALFFVPFELIDARGYSPTAAGAALLPMMLPMFVLAPAASALVIRTGPRVPLIAGPLLAALGFVLFGALDRGASYWTSVFPAAAVLGIGLATTVSPLTATVMNSVEARHVGAASGVNNAFARVAGLIGVAAIGALLTFTFGRGLDQRMAAANMQPQMRTAIDAQRAKLTAIALPRGLEPNIAVRLRADISDAFMDGYAHAMDAAAVLALLGAAAGFAFIAPRRIAASERETRPRERRAAAADPSTA